MSRVALIFLAGLLVMVMMWGPVRLVAVSGGSMRPTLQPGDICLIVDSSDITEGTVVLVEHDDGARVLHRVVQVEGDTFLTRGDANSNIDREPVRRAQIRGRLVVDFGLGRAFAKWRCHLQGGTLHNQSHS